MLLWTSYGPGVANGQCQYNVQKETTQQQNEWESLNLKDKDVKPTYCYFIKQRNFVKIGNSRDPIRMVKQISYYSPFKITLLHYTALVDEATVHKRFQGIRKSGEWFYYTSELRGYINAPIEKDREQGRDDDNENLNAVAHAH